MSQILVLSILGPDRPKLVEAVAAKISQHGGSWMVSRMSRLAGMFAGILQVEVPDEELEGLKNDLNALAESDGLQVLLQAGSNSDEQTEQGQTQGEQVTLECVGQDQKGIVAKLSSILAAHHINVDSIESRVVSEPWTGNLIFEAEFRISLPNGCDPMEVRQQLEEEGAALMVEVFFRE